MSTEIEYRHFAVKLDGHKAFQALRTLVPAVQEDDFLKYRWAEGGYLVFVEHGSNNDFDHAGRRARHWSMQFGGSRSDVMRQVIVASCYAESEMTRLRGRSVKAESYISAYRKLLDGAVDIGDVDAPRLTAMLDERYTPDPGDQNHDRRAMAEHTLTPYLLEKGLLSLIQGEVAYGRVRPDYYQLKLAQDRDGADGQSEYLAGLAWLFELGHGGMGLDGKDRHWRLDTVSGFWCDQTVASLRLAA
ncbi:MAG: hypothetical protein A2580_09190 [Hydrogenophilales bacterium RIFOXYD1_FULL_62_11]|nr:MAG: hypothetical protein A2580_09190 [Hydrogenophilales bacterium RIFOXYD1_FULL_62_11]